jgi:hypothetical protein
MPTLEVPTLKKTYRPGAALDLYAWKPPAPPTITEPRYNEPPIPTQRSERYNQSIAERIALPSTPPAVSITLENQMNSSTRRVPHVWSARVRGSSSHVGATTTTHTTYPPSLIAKIYDPVFFDDGETMWDDPFIVRDVALSCEVEAYQRLDPLHGTKVPRFYGYFAAAVPSQQGRTVYIILLERVPGRDLRTIVPPDGTENLCAKHRDAIVDAALCLFFDILACGVTQRDMYSRNIILRPQKRVSLSVSGTQFCETKKCLLVHEVDCDDLHLVMVDFEVVDFKKPDTSFSEQAVQRTHVEAIKSKYVERWLENGY